MPLPRPEKGMVIRYSYLWHHEANTGQQEGRKDRPCAIVAAVEDRRVVVVPITHAPPPKGSEALEIPPKIKRQIGLDDQKSWVILTELNIFEWPGPDLRAIGQERPPKFFYGYLPAGFTKQIITCLQKNIKLKRTRTISRNENSK